MLWFDKKVCLALLRHAAGVAGSILGGQMHLIFFQSLSNHSHFPPTSQDGNLTLLKECEKKKKIDAYFCSRQKFAFLLQRVTRKSNELALGDYFKRMTICQTLVWSHLDSSNKPKTTTIIGAQYVAKWHFGNNHDDIVVPIHKTWGKELPNIFKEYKMVYIHKNMKIELT